MLLICIAALLLASILMLKGRTSLADRFFSFGAGEAGEQTESVSVDRAPNIVVESEGGNVSFKCGPDGEVRISAVKHARSHADLDDIQFTVENRDNTVRIVYRNSSGRHGNCSVDFTVYAPSDAVLRVDTGGGNIDASGFAGGITAHSGGGMLASDVAGDLRLSTGGGDIRCDRARGNVVLNTGAGNVTVNGAITGASTVSTGGGNIDVANVDGSLVAQTGAGNVAVKGDLRGENSISTGAGNVHAHLGAGCALMVHASTNLGSASDQFGLSAADGKSIRGTLDGVIGLGDSGSLNVKTGLGNIDIDKLTNSAV